MALCRVPAVVVLLVSVVTIHGGAASATSCAGPAHHPLTINDTVIDLEQLDCNLATTVFALTDDASKSEIEDEPSTSRRVLIISVGVVFAVFLAVQQARSRLQTKAPDTL